MNERMMTILMCARKLADASVIYRTEPKKLKAEKNEKLKAKMGYAQKKRCRASNRGVSLYRGGKEMYYGNDLKNRKVFEPGVK